MNSPSSAKAEETTVPARSDEQPETTRLSNRASRGACFSAFTLIVIVLLVKLGLNMGQMLWDGADSYLPAFPEEVMAEERRTKPQDAEAQKKGAPAPQSPAPAAAAPPTLTDMVTHLEHREAELKKREEQMRQKEEYLSRMEQETEKKLKELIVIQKEIQAFRTEKEEAQNGKIKSLAKIYGTMKPKEAAKLLENLDDHLVVSVISTMTADEAGNILGNMDIKKAAKISESLSHR
ncbi:MAG: hypothetical protein MUF52_15750 [Syntrophobacteraceae bacterium]|jgi:flagellar motility protein MotE (MotC chaperone)|nr:hypothetical protein [Syntrophobacteraceae bacterium]